MKYKNITKQILIIVFFVLLIGLTSYKVYSQTYYSYGNFQLMLTQNGSIGVQQDNVYIEIELISANTLNSSAFIIQYEDSGTLGFISNIDGTIETNTNFDDLAIQINEIVTYPNTTDYIFNFNNGDTVKIIWDIGNSYANFYIGLIGVILFCSNPVLSWKLADDGKDKFKFFFLLFGIGIVSFGLATAFIYSGI